MHTVVCCKSPLSQANLAQPAVSIQKWSKTTFGQWCKLGSLKPSTYSNTLNKLLNWYCTKQHFYNKHCMQRNIWCRDWPRFFSSEAVVGRHARCDGRPHSCVVGRPTTAPDAKTWSISILPRSFMSLQSNHVVFEAELSAVKSVSPAASQHRLPRRVRRYVRAMTSQW